MPAPVVSGIHASRGLGDERRALLVLVEHQDEVVRRTAILIAELVEPLDRLKKCFCAEAVRIVRAGGRGLPDPDVEHEAVERLQLVEQPTCQPRQPGVSGDVGHGVEAGALLLPQGGVLPGTLDLEPEKFALALVEPSPEPSHFLRRQARDRRLDSPCTSGPWRLT